MHHISFFLAPSTIKIQRGGSEWASKPRILIQSFLCDSRFGDKQKTGSLNTDSAAAWTLDLDWPNQRSEQTAVVQRTLRKRWSFSEKAQDQIRFKESSAY